VYCAKRSSSSAQPLPVVIHPDSSTRVTASMSSRVIEGRENGRNGSASAVAEFCIELAKIGTVPGSRGDLISKIHYRTERRACDENTIHRHSTRYGQSAYTAAASIGGRSRAIAKR